MTRFAPRRLMRPPSRRTRRCSPSSNACGKTGRPAVQRSAVHALSLLPLPDLEARAQAILLSDASNGARAEALRILARTPQGLADMTTLQQRGAFPPELKSLATSLVHGPVRGRFTTDSDRAALTAARERAAAVFPPLTARNNLAVPTIRDIEQNFRVDPAAGRKVFDGLCSACHSLGGPATMGPDLSAIGTKLDRQALLDAIAMPSAAIAFGYESWAIGTTTRGTITGLLVENTPERVTVRVDQTQDIRLAPADITSRKAMPRVDDARGAAQRDDAATDRRPAGIPHDAESTLVPSRVAPSRSTTLASRRFATSATRSCAGATGCFSRKAAWSSGAC